MGAVQALMMRMDNNETVLPAKADTGRQGLTWAPVAGTHGTLSGHLQPEIQLKTGSIRQNGAD
jgi:hypothetical protein